jgi:hypothetical protein
MRTCLALLALLAVVAAGCGGGGAKKTKFTNANWGELQFNVQQGMYNNSPVDFVGQAFLVDLNEPDGVWVSVYADYKNLNYRTLVKVPDTSFRIEQNQFVHVIGTVREDIATPDMLMWDSGPVILASEATVVPQPSG